MWIELAAHEQWLLIIWPTTKHWSCSWEAICCVVNMLRRCCFLHCKSTLHALPKNEDACWNWYGKTDAIVTVFITVYSSAEEESGAEIQIYGLISTRALSGRWITTDWDQSKTKLGVFRGTLRVYALYFPTLCHFHAWLNTKMWVYFKGWRRFQFKM